MSRPRRVLWAALVLLVLVIVLADRVAAGRAAASTPVTTLQTDELASAAPFMGLGVEVDPYDSFNPTPAQWSVVFQRLDVMRPGFIRVVEPASDYFAGYDAAGNPLYGWSRPHVQQLLTILGYARSRGIPVVIGDWGNPLINGDARIPAGFLQQLHDTYGYTNIKYYSMINEPNDVSGCQFDCWTASLEALASELTALGVSSWLALVGPDNANSWDDTAAAQAIDRSSGLDADNPTGGDSWLTATLQTVPALIGAYDSHRYATIWGVENGVFGDQMRARREQINNLDSPGKPYFAGEVGMTARQSSPFGALLDRQGLGSFGPAFDPSARTSYAKALSLSAYRSQDGKSWEPVALASTNPAPSVGGGQYLAEVLPAEPIPAGTNRLKIEIGKGSEVGQVTIHARRAGPACLAREVQPGPSGLAGISLGASRRRVRGLFGVPSVAGTRNWHYCVVDGGEVVVVPDRSGAASLIASSAPRLRIDGIGPGNSVGSLWRRLRRHDVRSVAGRGLLANTSDGEIAFLTGHGQVRAVAIASTTLLHNTRSLLRALSTTHL